eukprot:CAMPEP_0194341386 /NCGR_PEP_ID=MMETSP0171-20130528/89575_1 /TAXON_ID=218684 /ORGANISM="Corethron pennatum, Strain L29A3" /LENGTH=52 /DNA_ID=CAMNT_0039106723 /DNA_START=154 /DNA_END=309 /DNA_ORIENTATION=-
MALVPASKKIESLSLKCGKAAALGLGPSKDALSAYIGDNKQIIMAGQYSEMS